MAAAQIAVSPGDVARNVQRHLEFARRAVAAGVRLLVFPELSLIGYELDLAREHVISPMDERLAPLRQIAYEHKLDLVLGAPLAAPAGLHLGAIVIHGIGSVTTYAKQHVHSSEAHVFTSGPAAHAFRTDGTMVSLAICRDATFASHAAEAARRRASLYAVSAFIVQEDYERKAGLLSGYAREHGMTVLLANYAGVTGGEQSAGKSAIWGPDGTQQSSSSNAEECLVIDGGLVSVY